MALIGIDLGTTTACVALWKDGSYEVITNSFQEQKTVNYVAFGGSQRIIGTSAVSQLVRNSKNTVFDVKRLIGRGFNDPVVQEGMKRWPFTVVDIGGKPRIQVEYKKKIETFAPEEITAIVLGKIKDMAETFVGGDVKGAVITVPAYFNNAQRQATIDAGKIAGLEVLRIINDTTAAALTFGCKRKQPGKQNVLVYDLGGGTFEATIIEIEDGKKFTVLASSGDTRLGGIDFDNILAEHFMKEFKQEDASIDNDARIWLRMKIAAEKAKKELFALPGTHVTIDEIDFSTTVTRHVFEELCKDKILSTLDHLKKVLIDAEMQRRDIDDIILIGGSSRIPSVRKLVQEFFPGKTLNEMVNPDEAGATGAAVMAGILVHGNPLGYEVNEINCLSFGIKGGGEFSSKIRTENTSVSCMTNQSCDATGNSVEASTTYKFEFFQSSSDDSLLLKTFPKSSDKGSSEACGSYGIKWSIQANGLMEVTASKETPINSEKIGFTMATVKAVIPANKSRMQGLFPEDNAFCVKGSDGLITVVVLQKTTIPCRINQTIYTENQSECTIYEFDCNAKDPFKTEPLASFILEGGSTSSGVQVTYEIDSNGIMKVTKSSAKSRSDVNVSNTKNFSAKEIKVMAGRAKKGEEDDEVERKRFEVCNQLVKYINNILSEIESMDNIPLSEKEQRYKTKAYELCKNELAWLHKNAGVSTHEIAEKSRVLNDTCGLFLTSVKGNILNNIRQNVHKAGSEMIDLVQAGLYTYSHEKLEVEKYSIDALNWIEGIKSESVIQIQSKELEFRASGEQFLEELRKKAIGRLKISVEKIKTKINEASSSMSEKIKNKYEVGCAETESWCLKLTPGSSEDIMKISSELRKLHGNLLQIVRDRAVRDLQQCICDFKLAVTNSSALATENTRNAEKSYNEAQEWLVQNINNATVEEIENKIHRLLAERKRFVEKEVAKDSSSIWSYLKYNYGSK